ncbi:MAG: carbohydrate ABC transporter permease [Eubacteriales bacterium]|nr:carbohydrate ABC transporter permease [Eubacteriales bacterium]
MKIKKSKGRIAFEVVNYTILGLLALMCIFPFIHLLAVSFSADEFTSKGEIFLLPKGFTLQAYEYLAQKKEFFTALGISVLRTVIGTAISLIVVVMTAYPLSKTDGRFKGRTVFTWFFLITMFLGGGLFATYFLYKQLGLLNSFLVYILPGACDVWFVLMLMNFFRGIPKEIEEAALIDGAGQFSVLFKLYIPLAMPSIATIILFTAIGQWNSWFDGIMFMNDPSKYPLQSYLYTMIISSDPTKQSGFTLTPEQLEALKNIGGKNLQSAQIFLGILPIALVFPFLQRFFVKGITVGSVKG